MLSEKIARGKEKEKESGRNDKRIYYREREREGGGMMKTKCRRAKMTFF